LLVTLLVNYLFDQPRLWRRGRWCPVVARDQTVRLGCRDRAVAGRHRAPPAAPGHDAKPNGG